MHRPTPLFRSFVALLAPLALLTSLAGFSSAEEASLSERLAKLRQSWLGGDEQPEAAPAPTPRSAGGDVFDALSTTSAAPPAPRVASRMMPYASTLEPAPQQRVGSVLGQTLPSQGLDIAAALGGTMPEPNRVEAAPTEMSGNRSAPQANDAATKPVKVAAKPPTVRRRHTGDLALDLISSTASSRDTSGVADSRASTNDVALDLSSSEQTADDDITPIGGPVLNESGFASAAAAAAAAAQQDAATPAAEQMQAVEIGTDRAEISADPWSQTDSAADAGSSLPDVSNSVVAERAFTDQGSSGTIGQSQRNDDVWVSDSTSLSAKAGRTASGNSVLMTEQLPLITSRVMGPKSILIGREAKYQVVIENRGSAAANQLSTEVVAPEWADVVHVVASAGTVQRPASHTGGTVLRWDLSTLEASRSQTLELVVVPKSSQPLSLGVTWRHAPVGSTTTVEVQEPKLAMALSGPDEVFFGRPQTYRLSLTNPGTGAAENVVVELMPPGGGQAVSSYRVDKLAPGESKVVDVEITTREAGELAIQAVATADGNLRAEAAQQIFCRRAELSVDWRGPERKYAGTEATYYFRVRNPGTASADQVTFDVTLPAGFDFRGASDAHQFDRSGGRVVWKIGTLRPGDDRYLELRGIVNQAGANALRLSAANHDGDVHDTKTATTTVVALADLKLDVSDPKGPVPVGAEVDYEITVTNRGRNTAEQVNIVGLFSAGIEPVSAQGAEATIADGRVGFRTIDAVPAGQQVKLTIRARALNSGTHLFRAEVFCRDLEIKLAAEETTRFFQDDSTVGDSGAPVEAASRASRFE